MQQHGFAVGMKVQCRLTGAGAFGRMWPSVYIHSQCWGAVVQFGTQLPFQEDKGKSLWLSLEKGLLSSQLPICGGATSAPHKQSQRMGVLEKT